MKITLFIVALLVVVILLWALGARQIVNKSESNPDENLLTLSEQLLYAIKTEVPTDSVEQLLSGYSLDRLIAGLPNNRVRKLFWINLYNAWYQILAIREKKTQPDIFTTKAIHFKDFSLSLDDVEHGILRKYRWKYSLGYLPQFSPSQNIKKLAVSEIDYRIHFALNCGAKSCPPIAFYKYTDLDEQLDLAARSFLSGETEVDVSKKEIHVTKIMYWFKGDFGGSDGIREILSKYLGKDFTGYKIHFKDYDWTEELKNFTTEAKADD